MVEQGAGTHLPFCGTCPFGHFILSGSLNIKYSDKINASKITVTTTTLTFVSVIFIFFFAITLFYLNGKKQIKNELQKVQRVGRKADGTTSGSPSTTT
jgi:hypothetical protein